MNVIDTIFDRACQTANLTWNFVYDDANRSLKVDGEVMQYPCALRLFRESVLPLFDQQQRVERSMNMYIVHAGFDSDTSEKINENLDEIMSAFVVWRDAMRRSGVEVVINGRPFPAWELTDLDEYGYIFDLTLKYSLCLS